MSTDQVLATIRSLIASVTAWLKLIVGMALAVLLFATLAGFLGYAIPYVPAFKGTLQDIGIFTAALAYWLK